MRFLVSEIRSAGTVEEQQTMKPEALLGPAPDLIAFRHPVQANAEARLTNADVIVTGHASTIATFTCALCLEPFERPIESDFQQVYPATQDVIDVDGDIRESILIDLPVRAVCRDECQGLCPTCGKNKNLSHCECTAQRQNPRWDILKKFRF